MRGAEALCGSVNQPAEMNDEHVRYAGAAELVREPTQPSKCSEVAITVTDQHNREQARFHMSYACKTNADKTRSRFRPIDVTVRTL